MRQLPVWIASCGVIPTAMPRCLTAPAASSERCRSIRSEAVPGALDDAALLEPIDSASPAQLTSMPSCDGDGAFGRYRIPSDAAKYDLAVAAADADATAACDGSDFLL
jgi:hypothetical protein